MFKLLAESFSVIRKDGFVIMPLTLLYLTFSILESLLFPNQSELTVFLVIVSYVQSVLQTVLMGLLVLMAIDISKLKSDFSKVMAKFSDKLSDLLSLSLVINIPLFLMLLIEYLTNMDSSVELTMTQTVLMLVIALAVMLLFIPYSAMSYFSVIHLMKNKSNLSTLVVDGFKYFFSNYRLSLRWFLMIMILNSFVLFLLPIKFMDAYFSDILFSLLQGLLASLCLLYSYHFYEERSLGSELNKKS